MTVIPFPRKFHTGLKGEFVPPPSVLHVAYDVEADNTAELDALLSMLDCIDAVMNVAVEEKRSA